MRTRIDRRAGSAPFASCALLVLCLVAAPAAALDPPASKVNPKTGAIEIADPIPSAGGQDLRYVIDNGSRMPTIETVSADAADDRTPRLALTDDGDAWVVWWRDQATDQVFVRVRWNDTASWGVIRQVSEPDESSSNPDIAHDGTRAWVAFEVHDAASSTTSIAVSVIDDEPDPLGSRVLLSASQNPSGLDVRAHHHAGAVWVSWVHTNADVGWSRFDAASGTWTLAAYESYVDDSIDAARDRIRAEVTGD